MDAARGERRFRFHRGGTFVKKKVMPKDCVVRGGKAVFSERKGEISVTTSEKGEELFWTAKTSPRKKENGRSICTKKRVLDPNLERPLALQGSKRAKRPQREGITKEEVVIISRRVQYIDIINDV